MKSFKYKFSSDSYRFPARHYLQEFYFLRKFCRDFHRIEAIFDILSKCNCTQFWPRTGILYDCSLFIQEFLAYTNRKRMLTQKIKYPAAHGSKLGLKT